MLDCYCNLFKNSVVLELGGRYTTPKIVFSPLLEISIKSEPKSPQQAPKRQSQPRPDRRRAKPRRAARESKRRRTLKERLEDAEKELAHQDRHPEGSGDGGANDDTYLDYSLLDEDD